VPVEEPSTASIADIRVCGDTFLLRISDEHGSASQNDRDFGELARLCIDLD
jgi:hypothetical protein